MILKVTQFFKCDFSYNCAAVEKISTNIARGAVSATADLLVVKDWLKMSNRNFAS